MQKIPIDEECRCDTHSQQFIEIDDINDLRNSY